MALIEAQNESAMDLLVHSLESEAILPHRENYIPISKIDLINDIKAHWTVATPSDLEAFDRLDRLLAHTLHFEAFERIEELRNSYFYLNPSLQGSRIHPPEQIELAYSNFRKVLRQSLDRSNFVAINTENQLGETERSELGINIKIPSHNYREVLCFARGRISMNPEKRRWYVPFNKKPQPVRFSDVLLMAAIKPDDKLMTKKQRRELSKQDIRPGAVFLKCFKNMNVDDLCSVYPNVRVTLGSRTKLWTYATAFGGLVYFVYKSMPTISSLIADFYKFTENTSANEIELIKDAIEAGTVLLVIVSFLLTQRVKFERKYLRVMRMINDNIYFKNINNNDGVLSYIVGASEEQEYKESLIAYYFLLQSGSGLSISDLDKTVEEWLQNTYQADIDFEVDDALSKLQRLGITTEDNGCYRACPIDEALRLLDKKWDSYFTYNNELPLGAG